MSAHLADSVLHADSTHEPDRYVQHTEDNGVLEFLSSVQNLLWLAVALIAVALLVWQLWSGRRDRTQERAGRQ